MAKGSRPFGQSRVPPQPAYLLTHSFLNFNYLEKHIYSGSKHLSKGGSVAQTGQGAGLLSLRSWVQIPPDPPLLQPVLSAHLTEVTKIVSISKHRQNKTLQPYTKGERSGVEPKSRPHHISPPQWDRPRQISHILPMRFTFNL